MNKIGNRGFTLLEILIAMTIFAIMSVMTYSGLRILLDAKAATSIKSRHLAELQMTLYLLNEDFAQIISRPVRDAYGVSEPAFSSGVNGELFTLTRSAPAWSAYQSGSQLQRVSYRIENGALYRLVWTTLDRTQQTDYQRRKLMALEQIKVRFLDSDWAESWLVDTVSLRIPKAVEMVFSVAGSGEIPRLFFIHD
ncbi:MAG: type II secretion system minor pseudopilin GspJ [Methylococcaceae bacterium]